MTTLTFWNQVSHLFGVLERLHGTQDQPLVLRQDVDVLDAVLQTLPRLQEKGTLPLTERKKEERESSEKEGMLKDPGGGQKVLTFTTRFFPS